MRITLLNFERQLAGTALHNAAAYDTAYLSHSGHQATREFFNLDNIGRSAWAQFMDVDLLVIEGACWAPLDMLEWLSDNGVTVVVRVHAAPEFIYSEMPGMCATDYIRKCATVGVITCFVSAELAKRFDSSALPIVYPAAPPPPHSDLSRLEHVHVGAFGSIRPLKNHIGQLLALGEAKSKWFAHQAFSFHINSTRIEGDSGILPELRHLAVELGIRLICHPWESQEHFKHMVIPSMSLGMFASFAESFCITAADFVAAGKPVVLGKHIPWAFAGCGTTVPEIAEAVRLCMTEPTQIQEDWASLTMASVDAKENWQTLLTKVKSHVLAN